ncbi:MAG: CapA family protein [bacterium]|nr:CapA family protein [bacterium]
MKIAILLALFFLNSHNPPTEAPQTTIVDEPKIEPLRIVFVGDMQFDRDIRALAERSSQGYDALLSPELSQYLQNADLVIGNLEGPITDNQSISLGSEVGSTRNYIFTFSPEITSFLQKHSFAVNLGNNHINNFGEAGFLQTQSYLDSAGISWLGQVPYKISEDETSKVFVYTKGAESIAFINYNQFLGPGLDAALRDIKYWKPTADKVIVYTHWGNEYEKKANAVIQAQAKQLLEVGADLIIGAHPHVVQQMEIIDGKRVYYSLGNFIFDQYFSPEVQQGLVVELEVNPSTGSFEFLEHPVQLRRGVTSFAALPL